MKRIITVVLVFHIYAAISAVHLNTKNNGQALIFPFYTMSNGLNTLFNVTNTTTTAKIIKVVFREGLESKRTMSLNVYLGPLDSWSAALLIDDLNKASLLTADESCTGLWPFNNNIYFRADEIEDPLNPLTEDDIRIRQSSGWIEVFEMATIDSDPLNENPVFQAIVRQDCEYLYEQYQAGGLWENDLTHSLLPVEGGLSGNATIVDVSNGIMSQVPVLHLQNFYPQQTISHTDNDNELPNLSSADRNSMNSINGQMFELQWPTGFEAVSSLFMHSEMFGQYNVESSVGASTELVMSIPTLRFYQSREIVDQPFKFNSNFGEEFYSFPITPCRGSDFIVVDASGQNRLAPVCPFVSPVPPSISSSAISVWQIGDSAGILMDDDAPNFSIISQLINDVLDKGFIAIVFDKFSDKTNRGINTKNKQAVIMDGLPVIGFTYMRFINANAQPGLLANYATTQSATVKMALESN